MTSEQQVVPVNIEEEMKSCYIDYAMSVIIGRAIPDVRDGLKPVHRRTLYAMWEMGNTSDKPYRKSARVVGDVMGKYHPHGDAAIYDTLVKMAQPFTYRYPLVDGQGNFGSIDGDAAAAMRYTEARLTKLSEELLADIDKKTVDFTPNFDGSLEEPEVLPARIPNLLINGSSGIAVGMATNMPPHNLREVCEAICRVIDNPGLSTDELMRIMPGPDFPTGGIIMGTEGIRDAYLTGRGKCVIRGVAEIEEEGRTPRIVITEIPYQVNKARLIEHIASLVRDRRIEGISDIRDESDREGMRIVIDLRRGVAPQVILNYLYKHTALESSFGIINLAIVDRQPRTLNLKEIIGEFIQHRVEVVRRRTEFDLAKAQERMHILRGLLVALDNIDAVVATIRASRTTEEAQKALVAQFALDEVQADAILKMQLRRLAALEQQKILDERDVLAAEIERLTTILSTEANILAEIRKELRDIAARYGDDRRTRIVEAAETLEKEDLIEDKPMLVSLTASNYIKRIDLDAYRNQRRGGRGVIGMATKEDDGVERVFAASMHDHLLCFTDRGRVYWLKVYDLPEGQRTGRGKALVNLLPLTGDERVTAVIPVREFQPDRYLFFATRGGTVAKVALDEFSRPRQTGINAIKLRDGDALVDVNMTDGNQELILTTRLGQSLRFHEDSVRPVHRNAMGVRGIRLRNGDALQSVTVVEGDHLLTITEQGFGKRTEFDEFRGHGRGTLGVRNIVVDARGGGVVGSMAVYENDEIIVMSASGIVIRTKVSEISIQKRGTRGVRIMRLDDGDRVVGFTILNSEDRDEE
ncbi:MAG TPA: DNA gyrase subunit A [Methanoculleus sp.]|nr:DNA gyrase subunit A [Methanoculleus sp.]MBP8675476.1 DNA gyrase subunit A [Methanoculleus sp.]HON39867.1 DNA gyrase subunit A [Methanoculleus sp.]HPD51001.1 DNA gyrase subunit A [Methanoculleus sp.]HRD25990.1 DNA gyrase subunit A [Methanoculleus sp.]